jgi:hypothetical protein
MTRDQIQTRVAENLYDEGLINFTNETINDSIQDGYDQVALLTGCIENITEVNWTGNKSYYYMPDLITDFYYTIGIWNNKNNSWLEPIQFKGLAAYLGVRWETYTGTPQVFCPLGYGWLAFARKYADTDDSMQVFHTETADTLSGSTTPTIPEGLDRVLIEYATGDLLDQHLEYTKSMEWFEKYMETVKEIHTHVNKRNTYDRYLILAMKLGISHAIHR